MTVRNLDAVFQPKSVAVIGASQRPGSIGSMVWRRLIEGGFTSPLWAVNPRHAGDFEAFDGRPVLADAGDLPEAPGIAIICTRPATWPALVHRLGGMGTRAAIIVGEVRDEADQADLRHALAAARPHLLRIVGPGSLGALTPALNAQLGAAASIARKGGVAWVSQSNALTNAVLRWAAPRGLGFSHVIALGDEADVDVGDVLDYLASDPSTRAILLEVDTIRAARKFMSAARAAARNKPVLALRSGRDDKGDALYTAAFRRAGLVRVDTLDDLLDEIETLGVGRVAASDTATLIASDRGVATLARDAFMKAGDTLARWNDEALAAIEAALPHAQAGNPLVLGDTAKPEHFGLALQTLAPHRSSGTAFVVHAPTHSAPVDAVARTLIEQQRFAYRGMLACFFGGVDETTRDELHAHGIPVHTTPRRLARAFARLVDYRLGRELLMQTPETMPAQGPTAIEAAQGEARAALAAGRTELKGEEAGRLLALFGLVTQAQDEPGVRPVVDVSVEFRDDDNFGPVFRFAAPSPDDFSPPLRVYSLPPLNPVLSRDIVAHSPYARYTAPEPTLAALTELSQFVCEVREIVGLRLTLRVLPEAVVVVAPCLQLAEKRSRFAIMPYPRRLEETIDWRGERLTIRPIRPEDEAMHAAFVASMTPDDLRLRFFSAVRSFDHTQLARMTQIDYDREMALIAVVQGEDGQPRTLGVVRAVADPDNETAEFAVAILSNLKRGGLGRLLMSRIIEYVRSRGTHWLLGEALRENAPMIGLARACGFTVTPTEDPGVVGFRMPLD
ncbi:GNAT family N-acetyltransferase [Paraburkholderia sp. CNPSo 3076]|uniref:bifunctional acetate--CoA ligase family protein/GNAT family N-acetyltransferase n=1 Tax=Paraburkholderia sp. CNPSo 3076 TaxID=2940936 RepID=UPI00225788D1|nr:GNAT family N-acetyltransferase [Paraburkholderia sp. CNPSo 3076]MCX5543594.1 GNAT family N-acetyltransferase [Paraburkholderia sp. CNPSo 3076]